MTTIEKDLSQEDTQRTRRDQVHFVATMTAVGAVVGVIVWVCFSRPIARSLPAGLSVTERMAAATLRLDRWRVGIRLKQPRARKTGPGLPGPPSPIRQTEGR